MKTKRSTQLILLGIAILLILLLATLLYRRHENSGLQKVTAKRGPIQEAIYGIGTVVSRYHFQFKVGQVTTVSQIFVQEGQNVRKDQPLFELAGGVRVKSPMDGTVTSLPYDKGENVFPETPVIVVENLEDRYVTATLEQQGALRVRKGLPVKINFESIRDRNFTGRVEAVYPQKGQFLVRIHVDQLPPEILPGMTGDTSIEVSQKENALLVPILAVSQGQVLVERNRKRMKVDVRIGSTDSQWAEIIGGDLQPDDTILMKR